MEPNAATTSVTMRRSFATAYLRNLGVGVLVTPLAAIAGTVMLGQTGVLLFGIVFGSVYAAPTTLGVMPFIRSFFPRSAWHHFAAVALAGMISGGSYLAIFDRYALTHYFVYRIETWNPVVKSVHEFAPAEQEQIRDDLHIHGDARIIGEAYVVDGPPLIRYEFGPAAKSSLVGLLSATFILPLFLVLTRRH